MVLAAAGGAKGAGGVNIELFPCSGGMSEGHRRAGIEFDVAFDKDPDACASHEHNLDLRSIQLDVHDLVRMARGGWRPGPVDYLCADPPCTPWSRAGKREGLADPRDCLRATAELIELLRPRAYLIGNVPGLQDSTSWHVVQEVIGGLAALGYCVVDYASLDAADYGVPQHRVRPFWFGHLDGPCIRWPAPTHGAPTGQLAIGAHALAPWVTCRDALGHLSIGELGRPVRMKIREKGDDDRKNGGDDTRCSQPDSPAATVVGKDTRKGGQILIPGAESKASGKRPFIPNGGDASMMSKAPGHHSAGTGHCTQHGPNAIVLSERAAGILQGFPDGWMFSGDTKKARWSQIGQAIPPPLAHAVAAAVAEQMRAARRDPDEDDDSRETRGLFMGML